MNFDLYFDLRYLKRLHLSLILCAAKKVIHAGPGPIDGQRPTLLQEIILGPRYSDRVRAQLVREQILDDLSDSQYPDTFQKLFTLLEIDKDLRERINGRLSEHLSEVQREELEYAILDELFQLTIRQSHSWSVEIEACLKLATGFRQLFQRVAEDFKHLNASLPADAQEQIQAKKLNDEHAIVLTLKEIVDRGIALPASWDDLDNELTRNRTLQELFKRTGWAKKVGRQRSLSRLRRAVLRVTAFVEVYHWQLSWRGFLLASYRTLAKRYQDNLQKREVEVKSLVGASDFENDEADDVAFPLRPDDREAEALRDRRADAVLLPAAIDGSVIRVELAPEQAPYGVAWLAILVRPAGHAAKPKVRSSKTMLAIPLSSDGVVRHRDDLRLHILSPQAVRIGDHCSAHLCPATERNWKHFPLEKVRALLKSPPACTDQALAADIQVLIERLERHCDGGHEMR